MPKTYIVNTNQTYNASCENEMINNEKCAAYHDPWKYQIDVIEANDIVFLYSNGRGIIARGIATGIPEITDCDAVDDDEEHYMNLNRFQVLTTPMPASKITEIVGHDIIYKQTIISLTHNNGINLWQYITKKCI